MSLQSALDFIRASRAEHGAGIREPTHPTPCLEQLLVKARHMGLGCSKSELIEAHRIDWKMRAFRMQAGSAPEPGDEPGGPSATDRGEPAYRAAVQSLYDEDYARGYGQLWNMGWSRKNADNLRCIEDLLTVEGRWMDLCCGGGWHLAQVHTPCEKAGIDLSEAQLDIAREHNPGATLIQGDVLEVPPAPEYDLVTCFWLSYGYLDDEALIERFCRRMTGWLKQGGNLILEVADARAVHTWNESERGRATSFRVIPRNDDGSRWAFIDDGGIHRLTTPDYAFFDHVLGPRFERHERRFRYNWCGMGRK